MLTAFDAAEMGLPRPEIAAHLYGADAAVRSSDSEWIRSRVRRALRLGEKLINEGYRHILNPSWSRPTDPKPSKMTPDSDRPWI